jgi:oxygen-independent coproporphyrinogen-3 oxidase
VQLSSTFSPSADKTRSLYLHVPFCHHRCGYCNFTLAAGRDDLIERYLQALATEIGWLTCRPRISTVYLGGGTPSHLSVDQLRKLFKVIYDNFEFADSPEISVECNPNDLNPEKAGCLAACGVNRISFGVQSFDNDKLKFLDREHTAEDVYRAVEYARDVTDNISLDMIFAVNDENVEAWELDLQTALDLSPAHMSTYELTIEKGTAFWNRRYHQSLKDADEDLRADMYELAIQMLVAGGLRHYEISSFAAPGCECRHNQSYWNGNDYLAFGPGASRFVDGVRETNHRSTTTYLKRVASNQSPVAESEQLDPRARAADRLVFGLRQMEGISISDFREATGFDVVNLLGRGQQELLAGSLITIRDDRCRLTNRGVMLYDWIANRIMLPASH